MSEEAINGETGEDSAEDFQISGGGAFVFEPGQGSMNENGQFVIEPGDWKYTENNDDIASASQNPESGFEKVTFDRFQEIMGEVDAMRSLRTGFASGPLRAGVSRRSLQTDSSGIGGQELSQSSQYSEQQSL